MSQVLYLVCYIGQLTTDALRLIFNWTFPALQELCLLRLLVLD